MVMGDSVVLILHYTGSVVLITLDRLCGADGPRLAIWPWAALWC